MPLLAYFSWTGGALIGLLFLIDPYIATPQNIFPQAERYFPIRIKSNAPRPDLVTFDTSVPTIVPPQRAEPELMAVAPVLENAFANLPEPVIVSKKMTRKRMVKTRMVDATHQNSPDVGVSYPPSW